MWQIMRIIAALVLVVLSAGELYGQIGKNPLIRAGTPEDQALTQINAAADPAQKLALIDQFAAELGKGEYEITADDLYVNYYIGEKKYDKAFEYGEKLFAVDPDNFMNAVNMARAAQEKGDTDKLFGYGEKLSGIVQRYKAKAPPEGTSVDVWEGNKQRTLESLHDNQTYVEQLLFSSAYRMANAGKRADLMVKFAQLFPESAYTNQAIGVAAASYQQAQNTGKMLEVANGILAKDANNVGMLLLLADYYSEKGEQLEKAEAYGKKIGPLVDAAKKPEGVTDEDWRKQSALQKGLALSALGQVNLQRKENAGAVTNLQAAAPLLKPDAGAYGRNQYRLGFALLNLKKLPEAKAAFTDAASVENPYKALALDKLKALPAKAPPARRRAS